MQRLLRIQKALRPVLNPLGGLYAGVMALRRELYQRRLLPVWSPPAPTVAVGNIGWGGSGKTPLAGWLLSWAGERGLRAALLTRGYRARPKAYPFLVPPGALAEEAGDEPLLLAREHPKAAVVVDPERSRGGRFICDQIHPDLLVLDDGFQHLAVARDMNLVLLRAEDLSEGWNRVLPAGSWREGAGALTRAEAFVFKVAPRTFERLTPQITARLAALRRPVFSFRLAPQGLRPALGGERAPGLDGSYLLVSGVGNPGQVERTATELLGRPPARHRAFPDHYFYTRRDVHELRAEAQRLRCSFVLCTPKDAVKLGPMADESFWVLDLELVFGPALFTRLSFEDWWRHRWETLGLRRDDRLERDAEHRRKSGDAQGGGHGPEA